jgi:hypothetical protein
MELKLIWESVLVNSEADGVVNILQDFSESHVTIARYLRSGENGDTDRNPIRAAAAMPIRNAMIKRGAVRHRILECIGEYSRGEGSYTHEACES